MHVAVIAARQYANTRQWVRLLAARVGIQVSLVKGDADPLAALPTLRDADRLWFEGTGPLLKALVRGPAAGWLPRAFLRIAPDEVDGLPVPDLWRLVRTVVAPDARTAERVRLLITPTPAGLARVEWGGDALDFAHWVGTPAGDLRGDDWAVLAALAERCCGRVRLTGNPPPEAAEFLSVAYGLEVVDDGPADCRILWQARAAEQPIYRVERLRDAAGPSPSVAPPAPDGQAAGWPLVSAVVPTHNNEDTIDRCLACLRRQTYPNLEIVVINDGSTDGTAERVAQHLDDPRVRYFDKPHGGTPVARNHGIAEARGEWIAWLDADDEAAPNRILAQIQAARRAGGADVIHSDGLLLWPDGAVKYTRRGPDLPPETLPARCMAGIATGSPVLNTSTTIRRDLYDRIGPYNPAFRYGQDYEFWCRCAAAGDVRFLYMPVPLVTVHRAWYTPPRRWKALESSMHIVRRLVEVCGEEALVNPVARDLHESPPLVIGRILLRIAIGVGGSVENPIFGDAERYLRRARDEGSDRSRQDAADLLDRLETYRMRGGPDASPTTGRGQPLAAAGAEAAAAARQPVLGRSNL